MTRRLLVLLLALAVPALASAHLCNDVFVQAKDNLAIKVDIRDGQLRIGEQGSFRVYLLNTMDRDIANINLEVLSKEFAAEVKPGAGWKRFPVLQTTKRGGQKEYFDVTLRRQAGVPDGRYEIGLRLFNGKNKRMEFKTVQLEEACANLQAAGDATVTVDGRFTRQEWRGSVLATDFYEYVKAGRYFENKHCAEQARFRVNADQDYVNCLLAFQGGDGARKDVATIYVASALDQEPKVIEIDRVSGTAPAGVEVKKGQEGQVLECRIPRKLLGVEGSEAFYLNLTRTQEGPKGKQVSYWRGNQHCLLDPMTYARIQVTGN